MYLKKVTISNFKNIQEAEVNFSPKINFITGMNGVGKTNLLDAIYYLSMTKSYFANTDSYSIKHGEAFFAVTGEYEAIRNDGEIGIPLEMKADTINSGEERREIERMSDDTRDEKKSIDGEADACDKITVSMAKSGEKTAKKNMKSYPRLSDHIGAIPIVMISPYDTALINESGEERRRFLNSILSQIDREYLRKVQSYNTLLAQRNKLLKSPDVGANIDLLDTFSERLSVNASYIYGKRKTFAADLLPVVSRYYKVLSGGLESIGIKYRSDIEYGELDQLHKKSRERDIMLKYTSTGVHRDDLIFTMEGHPIKNYGSQGQQKSFLISLKLAQFEIMKRMRGKTPILLLDDVFDKLDILRVESLLDIVSSDSFGQIFITDGNKVRAERVLDKIGAESCVYEMHSGRILQ
jgi:recF protein